MNSIHEEEPQNSALLNMDVVHLLFKYILKYKKHLAASFMFVLIITVTTLFVPYISRFIIDNFIVKQGTVAVLSSTWASNNKTSPAYKEIVRGIRISDSAYLVMQSGMSAFSGKEMKLLVAQGIFSAEKYTLVDFPEIDNTGNPKNSLQNDSLRAKLQRYVADGYVKKISQSQFLISKAGLEKFRIGELAQLRAADMKRIVLYSFLVFSIFCLQFAASYLQILSLMKLSQKAMRDLRCDLFAHIISLELSFFDKSQIGTLVNRVTNDIEVLNELFSSVLVTLFQDMLILSGITVIMFVTNVTLGLAVAITFPALIVLSLIFRFKVRSAYRLIRTKIAAMNAFLNEHISGIRIIQIFVRETRQIDKFYTVNKEAFDANMKQVYVYGIFRPLIEFFRWFAISGVLFIGAGMIASNRISYGLLVMFLSYIGTFFEPLGDLAEKFDTLQSATAAGEKILNLFNVGAVRELPGNNSDRQYDKCLDGEIRFDNVWFSYKPDQWILKGVSFTLPKNKSLAIVGETGSGKTTIANLLSRFYRFQKGSITIDGTDINNIPYKLLRSNIATVMQDVFLFSRTIEENITLNCKFDQTAFESVCNISHCDTFIKSLPNKSREPVMERGVTFSTGQRQLLAIARALYFDPAILILDEATSNIDTETERLIQDAISNLVKGRTSLIIAHRLSTIRNADNIIVLDGGRIVEQGDHQSLLAAKGAYFDLYNLQFESV
jgi:ABC-type multidrug transport system fused ATPase/permease subunit